MLSIIPTFVLLSIFPPVILSLHIINPETCSIPYLIPRKFQRHCDYSDAYFEPSVSVASTDGMALNFISPPDFETSSSFRSTSNQWTHEPFCLESFEAKNGFCVYTNAKFANGRGISIISTPSQILEVISIPIFKDGEQFKSANFAQGAKKYIRSRVAGPKEFVVTANATFERGQCIHTFTPILAIQHIAREGLQELDLTLLLRVGVERLPAESQKLFLSQYAQPGQDPYIDRIAKNAFATYIGRSEQYFLATLPENARFNHACRPNTYYQFDLSTFAHKVFAIRTIRPGEEITVSYISPYLNSTERQSTLSKQWGFNCTCSLCSSNSQRLSLSDTRLARMKKLAADLYGSSEDRNPDPEKAKRIVKLHELEGLRGPIANAYAFVALEYWSLGERDEAGRWAKKARESFLIWNGNGHEYYKKMVELLEVLDKVEEGSKERKKKVWW